MSFKAIFERFKRINKAIKAPQKTVKTTSWEEVLEECYDKGLSFIYPIRKVIYTDDKAERAVILEKTDTIFTIAFEKLYQFDDDELAFINSDTHGYWAPTSYSMSSVFDTMEAAVKAIFSEPPFKYNKQKVWAELPFCFEVEG